MTGRNTFRHDRTFRILTQVDHLRSGICLLVIVGYSNRIELSDRIIAGQDATRVFPGNGRTGFHLCPRNLAAFAFAQAALGHEVIDTAFYLLYHPDTSFVRSSISPPHVLLATISTIAACNWFSSRIGAVHPSR